MNIGKFKWLFGRNSEFWPTNMKTGMWAWVGHRLTGLALVVYVFMHLSFLTTASLSEGGADFDKLMATTSQPLFVAMDFMLVIIVIYHAMNGFRIMLFDLGVGIRRQKLVFWICMAVSAVLIVGGLWAIWHLVIVPGGA
ncbi:MAG: succinate dehydrogenase, cytochrome b556 subunit [Thermoplasmatota archaeon]|nr:succinate dehydrogenase, cytochrome b556 subunit [Candidatus Thermoplasmatota archaeon]MBU1914302.1 succinate dehydrogenase, cytochrome b556 subunit [Candidatus Thermoplasmatota archaeon]